MRQNFEEAQILFLKYLYLLAYRFELVYNLAGILLNSKLTTFSADLSPALKGGKALQNKVLSKLFSHSAPWSNVRKALPALTINKGCLKPQGTKLCLIEFRTLWG